MFTRFTTFLMATMFLALAGTATAGLRAVSGSNLDSQCQMNHSCGDSQGSNAQGDDNGQQKDQGRHYGENGSNDQGDDNGQQKDNGHHFGKSDNDGNQGQNSGNGSGSNSNGGAGGSNGGKPGATGGSVSVPEPATLALLGLGLLGCAVRGRRR